MTRPWAIYIRVSTDDQAEEGASIPAQRESCLAYCKARGWTVPADLVLIDDGYTGRNARRPGWQRLVGLLRDRQIQGVVAWKLKRLARSTRIVADLLDLLRESGTEMACVAESWDTTTPMGRAMVGVGAIFAQLESEDNGVQTSAAMQHLRRHGYWTGGVVPAGCVVEPADGGKRRKLAAGPDADAVRPAWARILAGESLRQVADWLERQGIAAPARGRAVSGGWTPVSARNLLLSPQVAGILVDTGTQAAVRARLAGRQTPIRRSGDKAPSRAADPSPLAGLIRCPACDSAMVLVQATGNGGAYRYFRCVQKPKRRCDQKDLRCEPIEHAAIAAVAQACQPGQAYQDIIRAGLAHARTQVEEVRRGRTRLLSERDQLRARISDLALRQSIGSAWTIAMEAAGAELDRLDQAIAAQDGTLAAARTDTGSLDLVLTGLAAQAARLPDLPLAEQARTLRALCDRVQVTDASVILDLYMPETNRPERDARGGSYTAQLWLPGTHGERTIRVVLPRACHARGACHPAPRGRPRRGGGRGDGEGARGTGEVPGRGPGEPRPQPVRGSADGPAAPASRDQGWA